MTPIDREKPLSVCIGQAATLEQARRLVLFAWGCVRGTPLSDGRTPLSHLRGYRALEDALEEVGRWLDGEPVGELLRAMHDEVFEAALAVGRFDRAMTGSRAACWSAFEVYQTALAAEAGELAAAARKAASAAALACRSGDGDPTPAALDYQERLFRETQRA